jgi:hypothetical protein
MAVDKKRQLTPGPAGKTAERAHSTRRSSFCHLSTPHVTNVCGQYS